VQEAPPLPPAVEALPARYGSLPLREELSGVVRARNQVSIRPEVEGVVTEVLARNGDAVERGQVLVRVEANPLRERLRQVEAALRSAEATAAERRAGLTEEESRAIRARALAEQGLVSDQELEAREAQLEAARAQAAQAVAGVDESRAMVAERRADLARTVVRAPIAGRIGRRDAEIGMVVDSGSILFVMGELDELVAEVPLTEALLAAVDVGTPVTVDAATLGGRPIRAEISRISPFLEASSFSTTAEIDLDNREGRLRSGMFVRVEVHHGETESATLVPVSAVWEDPRTGKRGVFVVADASGLAEPVEPVREIPPMPRELVFRSVEVLAEGSGAVGVRGVEEAEWVVTVGQHLLRETSGEAATEDSGEAAGRPASEAGVTARVRPVSWERVTELQTIQREDLLAEFLDKQRRVAAALGTEIPESESEVQRVLARDPASGEKSPNGGGG
jgi:RND family efflux transporter MFP subunit